MQTFLHEVAERLYAKYREDISSLHLLFPSRRARLFFNDALAAVAGKPLWQPHYRSIDEVMEEIAGLHGSDPIRLVAELYAVYRRFHEEPFEKFYRWGETLLADFDQIDKYGVEASTLFVNIAELKTLEADLSYLTDEQRAVIRQFWRHFDPASPGSAEKDHFSKIWNSLRPIYHDYRERLERLGLAYPGMVYRAAAERMRGGEVSEDILGRRYAMVGFNALSATEKVLFDTLQRRGAAEFFWDYDAYYTDDPAQEAGLFLRENIVRYPPDFPANKLSNFKDSKEIVAIAAPSDALQTRYVTRFLSGLTAPGKETAIVLTDENLLSPVLYAIPDAVEKINVTMGYPLRQSAAYTRFEQLIEERHPRPDELADRLDELAKAAPDSDEGMQPAFFALIAEQVYKLQNTLRESDIEITDDTFFALLRKVLQALRVPYEGEPLEGVQVMGILETRNLDFENVVILSVNDDTFPGNLSGTASFIPYSLRIAYGLPTPQHHEGVYGYYFYRLVQRAKRVHLVYSVKTDEKKSGEPSRYIHQLDYESPHQVVHRPLTLDIHFPPKPDLAVAKDADIQRVMRDFLSGGKRRITPSLLNSYVECPLKFYYQAIAGLKEPDKAVETLDSAMFGTIFHKAAELVYGSGVEEEDAVNQAITSEYFQGDAGEWSGRLTLIADIVRRYLQTCRAYDAENEGFVVEATEHEVDSTIDIPVAGRTETVRLGGRIDRLDRLDDDTLRVVDYKTGAQRAEFRGLDALFSSDPALRNPAALQALFYAFLLRGETGHQVVPALYYIRYMNRADYSPLLLDVTTDAAGRKVSASEVLRISDYAGAFGERMRAALSELFDNQIPFTPCADPRTCVYCPYNELCNR